MAIRFKCAHCRRAVAVTRRAAGTQVPCPVCRQAIDVPMTTTAICLREPTKPAQVAPAGPAAPAESPPAEPKLVGPRAPINYRLVGITSAAAVVGLAVLTLVAAGASRRPSFQHWDAVEASGPPTRAMLLAHLDKPLFDEPLGFRELLPPRETQMVVGPPVEEMQYVPPLAPVVQRRNQWTDEELRRKLLQVPELNLYKSYARYSRPDRDSFKDINFKLRGSPLHEVIHVVARRPDLAGLPMIPAPDCQLGKEPAERLQIVSTELRNKMFGRRNGATTTDMTGPVSEVLQEQRRYIKIGDRMKETGFRESSIPAVMQMLCVENRPVRHLVVEHLGQVNEKVSTRALAKIALFDLSAQVRAEALQALSERPQADYQQVLLDGLRYPWAPVADHAAEALVTLEATEALPALKEMVKLPDPSAPVYDPEQKKFFSREVVRINHLANCMLCHAPSKDTTELVRGRIPLPGEALPPPVQYYSDSTGIFVRADITYLRQDFSVVQPVDEHGAWPAMQRFDYLVRNRPLNDVEAKELSRPASSYYPQRDAVEYAIRELSALAPRKQPIEEVARR